MKTISIFNEKGGCGKTTHTAMLASYLAYGLGKKVVVLDYDTPTHHLYQRRQEENGFVESNPDAAVSKFLAAEESRGTCRPPYDIIRFDVPSCSLDDAKDFFKIKKQYEQQGIEYLIVDFPGRFDGAAIAQKLLCMKAADLVVVPVDTDRQTLESALLICSNLRVNCFDNAVLFWNRVKAADRKRMADAFPKAEKPFRDLGYDFSEYWINDFVKAGRDSFSKFFVRSTLCWPEVNARLSSPNLQNLYDDLISRV